jgi:helix-turn-helix protein
MPAAEGLHVGRKRVARLMQTAGLIGVSRRAFVTPRVGTGPPARPPISSSDLQTNSAAGRDPMAYDPPHRWSIGPGACKASVRYRPDHTRRDLGSDYARSVRRPTTSR